MITGTAITFVMPEMYASTARVKIMHDQPDDIGLGSGLMTNSPYTFDPYLIQTTFEAMQSEAVLSNVVVELNLNVKWGQRYYGGQTLTANQAFIILEKRIQLAVIANTRLVAITAYSDDRNEAAQIANAIARSYLNYSKKQQPAQIQKAIDALQRLYNEEEQEILTLRSNLVSLEQQYHIGSASSDTVKDPDQAIANAKSYLNEKHKLEKRQELHQLLKDKIEYEKTDLPIPRNPEVVLTDFAEPGNYPVRPNKPLCLALTLAMATVLGTLSGGVAVWLARRQENAMG